MKTKHIAMLLLASIILITNSCRSPNSVLERDPITGSYKGLAYIAFINDDDLLLVTRTVELVLSSKGIHPYVEGSGVGNCVLVKKRDAGRAVIAITENPELKGKGVMITKEFLPIKQVDH